MNKITDTMQKETFISLIIFLFALASFSFSLIDNLLGIEDAQEVISTKICIFYGLVTLYALYAFLYSIIYKLEFDEEKITLRTLFRKVEINIGDIEKYSFSKYGVTVYYQFNLYVKDKPISLNTKFVYELDCLLAYKQIPRVAK